VGDERDDRFRWLSGFANDRRERKRSGKAQVQWGATKREQGRDPIMKSAMASTLASGAGSIVGAGQWFVTSRSEGEEGRQRGAAEPIAGK
jgi:hypothetical protein